MKKNQVDVIFNEDAKRNNTIIAYSIFIVVIFIISIFFLLIYINKNQVQYVKYSETSNIKYDVYLKDNEYFNKNFLPANNQYISELIDHIKANFRYDLLLKENVSSYNYTYRIEANVEVVDKITKRSLYTYDETLLDSKTITSNRRNVSINENIDIDYNKYNDLILDFTSTYNLNDAESMLYINMYVGVKGSCDNDDEDNNESVTTLEIPLTYKTMSIDIVDNLVNNDDNVMVCSKPLVINIVFLIISIIFFFFDIVLIVDLLYFVRKTRSAKTIYEKELKKILNNYRSYIQKVNTKFDLDGYQVLKIDNFTDMLEIRDTTNQPILMVENGNKNSAYFIIPTTTKLLYTYCIKVSDIAKERNEK